MSQVLQNRFKRGASYRRFLAVRSGDPTGVVVTAALKPAVNGGSPGDQVPPAVVFGVTFVAHRDPLDLTSPPGFLCELTPAQTLTLTTGSYVMDGRAELGGDVVYTATEAVAVDERVTEDD